MRETWSKMTRHNNVEVAAPAILQNLIRLRIFCFENSAANLRSPLMKIRLTKLAPAM